MCCVLNTVFINIHANKATGPLLGVFAAVFVPACLIVTYDSFRPGARNIGRLGSPFLLLGQVVTAGVALPLYYTLYTATSGTVARPRPEYVWTALLSTLAGMLVPSVWMSESGWSYRALAIWQPFPVYMFVLNLILPPVIRAFRPKSASIPIVIATILCTAISAKSHVEAINSSIPFAKAFLPAFEGVGLGKAGHALFAADCAAVVVTIGSALVYGSNAPVKVLLLLVGTAVAGPGAAITGVWAWNELRASGAKKRA